MSILGKFVLIEKVENKVVVGFVGNAKASCLSEEQKGYIAWFYSVRKAEVKGYQVVDTYTPTNGRSTSDYNDFLIISK